MMPAIIANTESYETEKKTQIDDIERHQIPLNGDVMKENKNTSKMLKHTVETNAESNPNDKEIKFISHSSMIETMILQESNNDRKKLRNGKYINVEVAQNLHKVNRDATKNTSKQKTQLKKPTKRKSDAAEELKSKAPMLAQIEENITHNVKSEIESNQEQQESNDESENNTLKKTKTENYIANVEESKTLLQKPINVHQKCEYCCQKLTSTDIKIYPGHPNGAEEELIALTNPKLSLFTGEEAMVHEGDERPQNKITDFW